MKSITLIVEASLDAMLLTDSDGKIILVNRKTEELFGYAREEMIGQNVERLVAERFRGHPETGCGGFFLDAIAHPLGAGRDLSGLCKDGTEVPIEIGLTPVKIGGATFVLALIIDNTDRKRIEDRLRHQHNLLRTLIDNLPDYIYVKDLDRRFLAANPAMARLMGVTTPNQLLGKRDEDFYPEHASASFRADDEKVLRGEPIVSKDEPNTDKDGRRTDILTTKVPLHDNAGDIVGLVGISRDITELKRQEQVCKSALAEREKLVIELQKALDHVKTLHGLLPICAFCHKIRNANGTWERLESYISSRTEADFTHGFCPECNEKHYGVKMPAEAAAAVK